MTTTTHTCQGATTCKRPAIWTISENYGNINLYPAHQWSSTHYCKAHGKAALAVMLREKPNDIRYYEHGIIERRHAALDSLAAITAAFDSLDLAVRQLAKGGYFARTNSNVPDPAFAALLQRAVTASIQDAGREYLKTSYDELQAISTYNLPAKPQPTTERKAEDGD